MWLGRVMYAYVWVCMAMYGYVGLYMAMLITLSSGSL